MVEIFAIFREAYRGKALLIKSAVVAAAQVAVTTEDQLGAKLPKIIRFTHGSNVTGQFAGGGIIFAANRAYAAQVGFGGGSGNPLGKDPDPVAVLQRVTGRAVA